MEKITAADTSKESIESVSNFDAAKDLQKLGYAQELTRVCDELL